MSQLLADIKLEPAKFSHRCFAFTARLHCG